MANSGPEGPDSSYSSPVKNHSSLIFVYGTLRRGFCHHKYLESLRARFLSRGTVSGELYDLGGYPGAVPSEHPADLVTGEVYRLPHPSRALKVLDELEGARPSSPRPGFYRRELVNVQLEKRTTVEAWMYWLNRWHGTRRRIQRGDYSRKLEF
jgi:gamma-glutamylcyclotransferase (GGCT)/AIG2-like uncharacterized protein YtfP